MHPSSAASPLSPFDSSAALSDQLRLAIQYALLAPSSHNTQPWRFLVGEDSVMLCADRLRALPVVDPFDRELVISCGAALLNLRVALNRFGLRHAIRVFPSETEPDTLAHIRVGADGFLDDALVALFPAMAERVTTRMPFANEPVPGDVRQRLIEAGENEGAEIVCVDAPFAQEALAGLIAEADRLQFADPGFRRELAGWIHPQRRDDGMPALSAGMPALLDFATPIAASAIRTFDRGHGAAAAHHRLIDGSPLLVGIATSTDDAPAWLAAGQALERLLLAATLAGLTASYLNQPIEALTLRPRLRKLLRCDGHPQLLLRIGRGPSVPHAPRRPLHAVLS